VSGDHETQVKAEFEKSADAYVASDGHASGPDLEQLITWGQRRGAARVLDIATGGGHTAVGFAGFTSSVVATDPTESMLRAARGLARAQGATAIRFVAADVDALPFKDESFGVVTCRIAAHQFPELLPPLRQVARVLRRGGSFLVEDILGHQDPDIAAFMMEVERRRDPSHVRAFRQIEWTAFLRATGLTVIEEAVITKIRPWDDWTERAKMAEDAKRDLDTFVLAAPASCREAFEFTLDAAGRIRSFTTTLLLIRADRD
jgi:ubiquinone/menaquinone biosynthesis C-methylase UbiE